MRAKSITLIREILQQRVKNAEAGYKNQRKNLEEKYETEWIDSKMTAMEKKQLKDDAEYLNELRELLKDFENHNW